jgi:O-antigen/teichoic acid export membrane protein
MFDFLLVFSNLRALSFIGGADVIGSIISTAFWFFLASQLSPDEYGEIQYFIAIATVATAFVVIAPQTSMTVFSAKKLKFESTFYFISLILTLIASFIIMILFYKLDVIFLLFGYVLNILAIGQLLGKKLFSSYSKYYLSQKILTAVLGVIFLQIFGSDGIIIALSLSYVFFIIVAFKEFKNTKITIPLIKSHSKFIFNNYVIEILTKLNGHFYKFLIVPILGFAILGEFSLAQQLVNVGMIFTLIVFKFTLSHDSDGQENIQLKKITILISILIAILGFIFGPLLVTTFFPEYVEIVDVVKIISFCIIPMSFTKIFTSKLLGSKKNNRIVWSKVISITAFVIIILTFTAEYGIIALAFGYLLSVIIETICLIPNINFKKNN